MVVLKGENYFDISDTYIKMCEKAENLQDKWTIMNGDYLFSKETKKIKLVPSPSPKINHTHKELQDCAVWLPRQDQLQEILCGVSPVKGWTAYGLAGGLHKFLLTDYDSSIIDGTMEQYWLSFVMLEKYKKKWDGEEWILTL